MTKVNSTALPRARKPHKPAKPHKDFPLFAHRSGQWAKKVRGKTHYFGVWADSDGALNRWLAEKDALLSGRIPRRSPGVAANGPILADLVNQFLTTKKKMCDSAELSPYTYDAYYAICDELVKAFGRARLLTDILPEDFETLRAKWANSWGPVRVGSEINRARVVFNYGYKIGLLDRPMRFGEGFKRPSKKTLRLHRATKDAKMFDAPELRVMIEKASQPFRSMLLLAINGGLGNHDLAQLPLSALDLDAGWLTYPRPKTGIMRRIPLWSETIVAMREWIPNRPAPADEVNANLLFLTVRRNSWAKGSGDRPITHECRKLLDRLGIKGNRNFYTIRHTFETIGGESLDQVAVNAIMGHDDGSMASNYRERVTDERLLRVAEYVREWLFGKTGN